MEKKKALRRWIETPEGLPILPHFTPLPADAKGSTFGACGIRISGNPQFVDAVLSRLKDLIEAECGATRLHFGRNEVKPVAIAKGGDVVEKQWRNADANSEVCYIQIRERTARTRQRKVAENSDMLPNFDTKEEEVIPEKEKTKPGKRSSSPKPLIPDAPKVKPMEASPYKDSGFFMVDPMGDEEN